MNTLRTPTDRFFLFIKGIVMGAANKIPGVSGGIVALVAGFYEELIYSLQKLNFKAIRLLLAGRFKSFYTYVNGPFLSWLFSGIIVSYFSVSLLLDYLLQIAEGYVWGAFFGMILASLYFIYFQVKKWTLGVKATAILGLGLGLVLSFTDPIPENSHLGFVFFCGIISVSGMALPGLSGSYLLLLLGNYTLLLVDAVNALYFSLGDVLQGDFSFIQDPTRMRLLLIMGCFAIGSVVGLILFSNLLAYVLKKYHDHTIGGILGFIAGALGSVWPFKEKIFYRTEYGELVYNKLGKLKIQKYELYLPDFSELATWLTFFFVLLGIGIVTILELYGSTKKHG